MLIDWFTVGAQALNFFILVVLMKRFLYQPILRAIDTREQRIAAEIADADKTRAEATTERETFERKNNAFAQERAALLSQAMDEAGAERKRLREQARKEADALREKWQAALANEQQTLSEALIRKTREEVFAITRMTLTDLATAKLEQAMSEVFIGRVREMSPEDRDRFKAALAIADRPALVRSAFTLPDAQHAEIQRALNETFSADIPLRFEAAPDLISGIEVSVEGQKVAWSIADYLTSLEQGVVDLLKRPAKGVASP
jgi:F-type H+-transporting ATPase subunit b